jgi:hypothetical protein
MKADSARSNSLWARATRAGHVPGQGVVFVQADRLPRRDPGPIQLVGVEEHPGQLGLKIGAGRIQTDRVEQRLFGQGQLTELSAQLTDLEQNLPGGRLQVEVLAERGVRVAQVALLHEAPGLSLLVQVTLFVFDRHHWTGGVDLLFVLDLHDRRGFGLRFGLSGGGEVLGPRRLSWRFGDRRAYVGFGERARKHDRGGADEAACQEQAAQDLERALRLNDAEPGRVNLSHGLSLSFAASPLLRW